jgi:hypothetical protein
MQPKSAPRVDRGVLGQVGVDVEVARLTQLRAVVRRPLLHG